MLPLLRTLAIRFDVDKVNAGNYGGTCWQIFWRAVQPDDIRNTHLFAGDAASSFGSGDNVYCIAIQSHDLKLLATIKTRLIQSDEYQDVAADPPFAEDENAASEPLVDEGRIDSRGNLVGNAMDSLAAWESVNKDGRPANDANLMSTAEFNGTAEVKTINCKRAKELFINNRRNTGLHSTTVRPLDEAANALSPHATGTSAVGPRESSPVAAPEVSMATVSKREIESLTKTLRSPRWKFWKSPVRAAKALGKLGPEAGPAVPPLIEVLNRTSLFRDPQLQSACIEALGNIGPTARCAVPHIMAVAKDVVFHHELYIEVVKSPTRPLHGPVTKKDGLLLLAFELRLVKIVVAIKKIVGLNWEVDDNSGDWLQEWWDNWGSKQTW